MQSEILKIENLSHKYHASWAVRDINLSINQTGIVGLLGSNGAGKSTTMNIVCGVLNQTEGRVYIDGIDTRKAPKLAKSKIGFLPQAAPLYLDLTVDEYLNHCAHLRLMDRKKIRNAVDEAKDRCGISHFSKRLISNLSGGYKQRVGIAQAIIHTPKMVVLDEPTNGLDPNQIIEVRSLIREIALDRLVIFSSHILSEVQILCNHITMIESGQMVFSDTMEAFNNYVEPHSMIVRFENPPAKQELAGIAGISKVDSLSAKEFRLFFSTGPEITETVLKASLQNDWKMREVRLDRTSIDEIFAHLSKHTSKNNNS